MFSGLFQDAIYQTKDVIEKTFGVVNRSSVVIACSDVEKVGTKISKIPDTFFFSGSNFHKSNSTYFPFEGNSACSHAVFVDGTAHESQKYAKLLAVLFENISKKENKTKVEENFIKNLLFDNILLDEIEFKALELSINKDASRVCFIIKTPKDLNIEIFNFVKSLFPNTSKDFVVISSSTDITIVKEISDTISRFDLEKLAKSLLDAINSKFSIFCSIGIGKNTKEIKDISKSFKEAKYALKIGKIFESKKAVISYEQLGMTRLIHSLPQNLCKSFLEETFGGKSEKFFSKEMLTTLQKFFENNLNVSETSRNLFIHRNTLIYRLSKIKRITGLDVRDFDDAIAFQVALMIKEYLKNKTNDNPGVLNDRI